MLYFHIPGANFHQLWDIAVGENFPKHTFLHYHECQAKIRNDFTW